MKWKFADMNLIVGSNLQVFRSPKYPAISLRLQDLERPLTAERCLGYYLENKMADVPILMMGLHRRGILCGYRAFRTEDIPLMAQRLKDGGVHHEATAAPSADDGGATYTTSSQTCQIWTRRNWWRTATVPSMQIYGLAKTRRCSL